MLQNAYLLAKIGADTAENERNFAKNWPPAGRRPARGPPADARALRAALLPPGRLRRGP